MIFNTISVIGLGYIGLPTAAMFASCHKKVFGIDVNSHVVDTINRGKVHIVEPQLETLVSGCVADGFLSASTKVSPADAFLIAVPTPFKENHEPDLSYIAAAVESIAPVLTKGNVVILESTSPVGTTLQIANWLAAARPDLTFPHTDGELSDIRISYCPERVIPGRSIHELVENDRIIGGLSKRCAETAAALYKIFVKGECLLTNARTAEMTKLVENSFRDVNIAFANELSIICDKLNINVWELIQLANHHPRVNILQPGPGVGGHCIAVDPWFIISQSPVEAQLIHMARQVNEHKPLWVIQKVEQAVHDFLQANPHKTKKDLTLAVFGLTFKPDIDDLRESPALDITAELAAQYPNQLLAVDPNITAIPASLKGVTLSSCEEAIASADILILLVDHHEFRQYPREALQQKCVVDTKGIWR